jgi:hypothetical protein
MATNNKITELDQVLKYLSRIPRINNGGCGVSALAIYRWLEKEKLLIKNSILKHKDTRFVFLYEFDNEHLFKNNKKAINNPNVEAIAPNHAVIFHKGNYIDCDGTVNISRYEWIQNIRNEEFILRANNNVDYWNPDFDRNKYIKLIEKRLNINLSDIQLRVHYPWEIMSVRYSEYKRVMKRKS